MHHKFSRTKHADNSHVFVFMDFKKQIRTLTHMTAKAASGVGVNLDLK